MKFKNLVRYLYSVTPFKRGFFTLLRSIFELPPTIYKHLSFKGKINVKVEERVKFKIYHHGYQVENDIFWSGIYGNWERVSLKVWSTLCKNSSVALDIGANTGVYSLLAKSVNPNASVFAFEPIERVYSKLEKNIEINKYHITAINDALSNNDGKAIVYDTASEHTYSVTVNKNLNTTGLKTFASEITTKRLDTFIKEYSIDKIDLMKIDVETHEVEVLVGMGEYLEKFFPVLLIEILNEEIAIRVEELLRPLDYQFYEVDETKGIRKTEQIVANSSRNYLCLNNRVDLTELKSLLY